jgi:hypothetical protein
MPFHRLHFSVPPSRYFLTPFRFAICTQTGPKTSGIQRLLNVIVEKYLFSALGVNFSFSWSNRWVLRCFGLFFPRGHPEPAAQIITASFTIIFQRNDVCVRIFDVHGKIAELASSPSSQGMLRDLRGRGRLTSERSRTRSATSNSVEVEAEAILRTALVAGV